MVLFNFAIPCDLLWSTSGESGGFLHLLLGEVAIRLFARED